MVLSEAYQRDALDATRVANSKLRMGHAQNLRPREYRFPFCKTAPDRLNWQRGLLGNSPAICIYNKAIEVVRSLLRIPGKSLAKRRQESIVYAADWSDVFPVEQV